jgi:hypothetical protein
VKPHADHVDVQYAGFPGELYFIPMYCVIVQLYATSFMAALNMRPRLRQHLQCTYGDEDAQSSKDSLPIAFSTRMQTQMQAETQMQMQMQVFKLEMLEETRTPSTPTPSPNTTPTKQKSFGRM